MKFLGITIHNIDREDVLKRVRGFLDGKMFAQVATVNPEFILEAQDNGRFRRILNGADLCEIDGVGVSAGLFMQGMSAKHRIPGVDLMHEILALANEKSLRVCLVLNKMGLSGSDEVRRVFSSMYPRVSFSSVEVHPEKYEKGMQMMDTKNIDIVLVGTGAPYQEYFIEEVRYRNPGSVKLAMGVGGSFDFVTGKVRRAPKMIRNMGLEWLWRLIEQPKRIRREIRKIVLYPLLVVFRELPPPFLKFLQSPREYRFIQSK